MTRPAAAPAPGVQLSHRQVLVVLSGLLLTSTITVPLYGKLSDMCGRRPFYLFAIGVFVVGSLLCGTAQSIHELAVWRAVQGLGAGGLMSLAFAIVGDLVPPREAAAIRPTSWACSPPPACWDRSSAAPSPARRRCWASTAGAGSSRSTCRSAAWRCSSWPATCSCPAAGPSSGSTTWGRRWGSGGRASRRPCRCGCSAATCSA